MLPQEQDVFLSVLFNVNVHKKLSFYKRQLNNVIHPMVDYFFFFQLKD